MCYTRRAFDPRCVGVAVCNQAMDLLGNHSVLHSNRVEKAFRDSRLNQIYEGTNEINRLAVIEDLQEELLGRIARTRPNGVF